MLTAVRRSDVWWTERILRTTAACGVLIAGLVTIVVLIAVGDSHASNHPTLLSEEALRQPMAVQRDPVGVWSDSITSEECCAVHCYRPTFAAPTSPTAAPPTSSVTAPTTTAVPLVATPSPPVQQESTCSSNEAEGRLCECLVLGPPPPRHVRFTQTRLETGKTELGDGSSYYLDRQTVDCQGYPLSSFHMLTVDKMTRIQARNDAPRTSSFRLHF